jgi:hypothetical protein
MPTKYVLSANNGDHINAKPTRMLIFRIIELEVIREQIGGSEQCWNKLVELIYMESTKTHI